MALKATKLIREAKAQSNTAEGFRRRAELLIQARDWARAHRQHRLEATARRLLGLTYIRTPMQAVSQVPHRQGCHCVTCRRIQ